MRIICTDLYKPILTPNVKRLCQKVLVNHIHETRYKNKSYANKYIFCEVLNVIHVLIQMKCTDMFLGGEFTTYGLRVFDLIDQDPLARVDPMAKIFPKMTKCTFQRFGPSGSIQRYDNLCILPLNILNEKGYLVIWFWLVFLLCASVIQLVHRCAILMSTTYRWWLLSTHNSVIPPKYFELIQSRCSYGDWFLLHMLSKNLHPMHFRDVIVCLAMDGIDHVPNPPDRSLAKEINTEV